jgi:hypothetical protein
MRERKGGFRIACTKQPANDQLGIGADRRPGPNIASGRGGGLGFLYVVILGVNEGPDFIHLDALKHLGLSESQNGFGHIP